MPTKIRTPEGEVDGYFDGYEYTAREKPARAKEARPAARPGTTWVRYTNTKGEIYWVPRKLSAYEADMAIEAAKEEAWRRTLPERQAAYQAAREAGFSDAPPPPTGPPQFRPGETDGYDYMKELIAYMKKRPGQWLGGKISFKNPLTGKSVTLVEAGELSTSVKGERVGPYTVDGTEVTAVQVGAVRVTKDGRVVGSVSRGPVTATGAVDAIEAGKQAATGFTEGVVNSDTAATIAARNRRAGG